MLKREGIIIINTFSTTINTNLSNLNTTKKGEVTSDGQGLRKESNSTSEIISKVSKGSTVNVLCTDKGWAKVNYRGKIGYLDLSSLRFNEK